MSQIRERKTAATPDLVPAWDIPKPLSIDPGNAGCNHGEVHAIHDGMGSMGLSFAGLDALFDLFEAGFDFSLCAIVLHDLFVSHIEMGREEGNPQSTRIWQAIIWK